jgi:hypothetical protein
MCSFSVIFWKMSHSFPIHAKIKVEPTMDASTVKEESLSEEPEYRAVRQ